MAIRINSPFDQFFESDGSPLDNGYLYIGTANLNPVTNPISTYWDEALTQPAAQPLRTMNGYLMRGNSPGRVYIGNTDYSIMLKSCNGTVIWSALSAGGDAIIDVLNLFAAADGSDLIGYVEPDSLDVMTVQDRLNYLDGVSPVTTNSDSFARANINTFRDTTGVAGGTPGFVNAAIISKTVTGKFETAAEWNILGILDNYSDASENVAGYFQGNKFSTGSTWGSVSQVEDHTGAADPVEGLFGLEVDIGANGTDANNARFGIQLVAYRSNKSGAVNEVGTGLYIGVQLTDLAGSYYDSGILLRDDMVTALNIASTGPNSVWGIRDTGNRFVGAEFAGTYSAAAIRLKAGEKLAFDLGGTVYLQEVSGVLGVAGAYFSMDQSWNVPASVTQLGRGAAGAATALPANPTGYLQFRIDGVNNYVVPYYLKA